jgi:WD40 repeat protein
VFSPGGRRLVTYSDETATLWDVERGTAIATLASHNGTVLGAVYSPDGRFLATHSGGHTAKLWNENGIEIATLQHASLVESVAFNPDGRRLVTVSSDGTIKLWDLRLVTDYKEFALRDEICAARLSGATRISARDVLDPVLRGRLGLDVCALSKLSLSYWRGLLRHSSP